MPVFCAALVERDGYGNAAIALAKRLRARGFSVRDMAVRGLYPDTDAQWHVRGRALTLSVPLFWERIACQRLAGWTMFESTRLPNEYAAAASRAERVIVPNAFCQQVWREQVRAPVDVVPLGVDVETYRPVNRAGHASTRLASSTLSAGGASVRPYTFLWSGTPDARKGWDVAYRAFYQAFEDRSDVRLVMHFRQLPRGIVGCDDSNVTLLEGDLSPARWQALLAEADVFLYPARGEGWGLVPREAAATGLPALVTEWGGLADETARWAIPIPAKGMVAATFGPWERGEIGEWAEPDRDALVEWMRWCVREPEKAARIGAQGAAWLAENRNWDASADRLCAWMEEVGWRE